MQKGFALLALFAFNAATRDTNYLVIWIAGLGVRSSTEVSGIFASESCFQVGVCRCLGTVV
jgi:hypothetical protein